MKKAIIYILILASAKCIGQSIIGEEQVDFNLKGKVESILIEAFKPVIENNIVIDYKYNIGIIGEGSQKYFFDSIGNLKMKYQYESEANCDSIQLDAIWTYYYTEGRLDSIIRKDAHATPIKKGYRPSKIYFSYLSDSTFYRTTNSTYSNFCRIRFTSNQRIKESLNKDSIITKTKITTFDNYNRKIKIESFKDKELSNITIQTYKNEANKYPNFIYDVNLSKSSIYKKEHEYNKYGDVIKSTFYKKNGEYKSHWSFQYEYDELGNWIKKLKKNKEGKILYMFKRSINYKSSR